MLAFAYALRTMADCAADVYPYLHPTGTALDMAQLCEVTSAGVRQRSPHLEFMRPRLQAGTIMGLPMMDVSCSRTASGVGPASTYRSTTPPVTRKEALVGCSTTSMPLLFSSSNPCALPSAHGFVM